MTKYYWIENPLGLDRLYVSARGYEESNKFQYEKYILSEVKDTYFKVPTKIPHFFLRILHSQLGSFHTQLR